MAHQYVTFKSTPLDNYNYFFNPNVCHVCKCTVESTLKTCILCDMISYCSEEHRILHRQQHEMICSAIIKVNQRKGIKNIGIMSIETWTKFQKENIQLIQSILCRDLEKYEKQMFLFAKSCYMCRKQVNLIGTCGECKSINICPEHSSTGNHECSMLRLCLTLDICNATWNNVPISTIPKEYLDFNGALNDMQSFIRRFCAVQIYNEGTVISWEPLDYIISEKLSGPMTLCNVLVREGLLIVQPIIRFIEIHIIAENAMDVLSLSAWEIVLHVFPPNTKLVIVTIGKKAPYIWIEFQVCEQCKQLHKALRYESHTMSYTNYTSRYGKIRPIIILVFHDEYEDDLLSVENLRTLQLIGCPVILTTKSINISFELTIRIKLILSFDTPLPYCIYKINKFSSRRPQRDIGSCSVFFSNTHLVVYDNLNTLSNAAQACSSVIRNV
ncbi:PREDICTED: uncharacterized protein LOC106743957 [Dinoponera quadriceps]|uniref:Uncharacterized protein LOC106743957 n=1 Tax=Dinoponera quadriceps TaxID=609295 RepID=A0A6P3X6B6_DINQU|nr:PREDICTED: uncharacterized protein LOC106743957 [Dinoponera quadriceps]